MNVRTFFKQNEGALIRIGTKGGSGFLYAGVAVYPGSLRIVEMKYRVDIEFREIVKMYESVFGGAVVLIEGDEHGRGWFTGSLDMLPDPELVPLEYYQRLAASICAEMVTDYKDAYIAKLIKRKRWNEDPETVMNRCEQFFRSPRFNIFCPNSSADEIIRLIKRRAERTVKSWSKTDT